MKFTCEPDSRPLPGYTIRRAICRGGFGEVYFAITDAGKEVALKLIFADQSEKELRGITQCLNLKHANLVNLFDVKVDGAGRSWVVMEYVSGSSLEDVLTAFPNGLPIGEVESWLAGIVAGVAFLHEHGIVHRDLKPANIYREHGVVKVGDVGLSRRLEGPRGGQYTESIGTVYYMAPEVAHGQYGTQVDVYSLGIILYEMLTGRVPFEGETTGEVLMKHLSAAPDLERLPLALRPVLGRALQKDPAKRTRTPAVLLDELKAALHGSHVLPESAFLPETPRPRPERFTRPPDPSQPDAATARFAAEFVRATASDHAAPWKSWAPWVAFAFVMVTLWAPHALPGFFKAGLTVGAILLVLRLTRPASAIPIHRPVSKSTPPPMAAAARRRNSKTAPIPMAPGQSAYTWLIAAVGGLAVCSAANWGIHLLHGTPLTPTPEGLGLFVGVTILGAWLLTTTAQFARSRGWKIAERRWLFLAVGALLGGIAWQLDQTLLFDFTDNQVNRHGISYIGSIPLRQMLGGQPTAASYTACFMLLAWWGGWLTLTDPSRTSGFRVGPLIWTGILAFVIGQVLSFPPEFLAAWGVTLSATVQLASLRFWGPSQLRSTQTLEG